MSTIIFDCLVPPAESEDLAEAFKASLAEFEKQGRISDVTVSVAATDVEQQLVEQWETEHPDEFIDDRSGFRYTLSFEKLRGSLNELAMDLSELLTPATDLPPDYVLREFDELLQGVATYPWTVNVRP